MENVIRIVCIKFSILYSHQSPDLEKNSDGGISDVRISGQSLIKRNCHNSWISDDVDMKLRQVTKLDKRNETTPKKNCNDVMLKNYDALLFFQFMANLEQSGSPILET